jgi:hypothetical protein
VTPNVVSYSRKDLPAIQNTVVLQRIRKTGVGSLCGTAPPPYGRLYLASRLWCPVVLSIPGDTDYLVSSLRLLEYRQQLMVFDLRYNAEELLLIVM